jgi:predicted small secreted protein
MKWKSLLLGTAIGFTAGYLAKQAMDQNSALSPEKILITLKKALQKDGKIIGSWILMTPEPFHKLDIDYQVYKGGITRKNDVQQEQFEFVVDANTGTVLELTKK